MLTKIATQKKKELLGKNRKRAQQLNLFTPKEFTPRRFTPKEFTPHRFTGPKKNNSYISKAKRTRKKTPKKSSAFKQTTFSFGKRNTSKGSVPPFSKQVQTPSVSKGMSAKVKALLGLGTLGLASGSYIYHKSRKKKDSKKLLPGDRGYTKSFITNLKYGLKDSKRSKE